MYIYIYIYYKSCIFGPAASIAGASKSAPAATRTCVVSELDPAVGTAFDGGTTADGLGVVSFVEP